MGTWTDKKIEKLKILWEKGVPTAEIGKRLDFSKNAIVGKVHRLGLSNRNSPIKTKSEKVEKVVEKVKKVSTKTVTETPVQTTKKIKEISKKVEVEAVYKTENKVSKPVQKTESVKTVETPSSVNTVSTKQKKSAPEGGVPLIDLGSDRCCWPVDDPNSENFHFCGKKVFKNKPYCLEHCAMAYTTLSSGKANPETKPEVKKETE